VEGEQEGMAALDVPAHLRIHLLVGAALALVFDNAITLADGLQGEDAGAVDGGPAGGNLAGHSGFQEMRRGSNPDILARSGVKSPFAAAQNRQFWYDMRTPNRTPAPCSASPASPTTPPCC